METVAETVSNRSRNSAVVNVGEGWERDVIISDLMSLTSVHARHLLARDGGDDNFRRPLFFSRHRRRTRPPSDRQRPPLNYLYIVVKRTPKQKQKQSIYLYSLYAV